MINTNLTNNNVVNNASLQSICHVYKPPTGNYDEMCIQEGQIRSHWQYLVRALEHLGSNGIKSRWREARRLIRENGVTYNIHGDPQGIARPWELDLLPLLIKSSEWAVIERGLVQRAELLNQIMLDLYGPRRLLKRGLLPPELVFDQDFLLLACDGIQVACNKPLVLYAADLIRIPNGELRVIGDRTQAPSGAGYALENRIVLSRVLPSLFRDSHVHRLAGFFRTLRNTLHNLAPRTTDSVRIVLLSPGPRNDAYFEHAYLANYLGYTLVQADDLTARDGALWLRTLNGLERVDVVLRRVDDVWCDTLELRGDSSLGVPGLLQAVRAGNVTLANALGSRILEHPALGAFLPAICRDMLGEDLELAGVQTWWCGNATDRSYVLDNIPNLIIKSARSGVSRQSVLGADLNSVECDALKTAIRANPAAYVGQEIAIAATAPVIERNRLEPRTAVLRAFLVAETESYAVMPGGLTRVAPDTDSLIVTTQLGGIGKDTWVLASEPERDDSLVQQQNYVYSPAVRVISEVSSRVADNLYWIGRYAERAEGLVRLLRVVVLRTNERMGGMREPEQNHCLRLLLAALTNQTLTFPGFVGTDAEEKLANPEPELISLITDLRRIGGLPQTLQALGLAAWSVRDRMSMDTWRIINSIDEQTRVLAGRQIHELEGALDQIDPLVTALAAFAGLTRENMTHGYGWLFLDIGRRLERAINTTTLLTTTLVTDSNERSESLLAESVLSVTDSLITYRRRYQSGTRVGALLDLVFQDETNPRSLAFSLVSIGELLATLPRGNLAGLGRNSAEKLALEATSLVRLADIDKLANVPLGNTKRLVLEQTLLRLTELLPALSDEITAVYFRHEDRPHSLLVKH
jgi:uncharacterized circularly permuted ATP-grasp superfamily protein/uncharacterized alpha-E superfamily protein